MILSAKAERIKKKIMYHIIIQHIVDKSNAPKASLMRKWATFALSQKRESGEITIRIVDEKEMTKLNETFRYKKGPTNVLSFPFDMPDGVELDIPMLGDIVICADVVNREAMEQHKTPESHWAHMIIHGVFHLLGYDHQTDAEATVMETLEIQTMQSLGFSDPYYIGDRSESHE